MTVRIFLFLFCARTGALLNDDASLATVGYTEEQLLILAVSKRTAPAPAIPAKRSQINAASDGAATAAAAATAIATAVPSAAAVSASAHKEVAVLAGHTEEVTSLAFDPSGRYIASGGCDM